MNIFIRFFEWNDRLCEANEKLKQTSKPKDPRAKRQKGPFPYTPAEISQYLTKASKHFSYFPYIDRFAIERCDLNLIQQAASLSNGNFLCNSIVSCLDMGEYGIVTQCRIRSTPTKDHDFFSVGVPNEYWNSAALVFALSSMAKTANIYWDLDEEVKLLGYVCITPEPGESASNCPRTTMRLRKILKSMKADYKKQDASDTNIYLF